VLNQDRAILGVFDPLYNGDAGKEGRIVSIRLATAIETKNFPLLEGEDYLVLGYSSGDVLVFSLPGFIAARPKRCDGTGPDVVRRNIACTLDLEKAQEAFTEAENASSLVPGPLITSYPSLKNYSVSDGDLVIHVEADRRTVWASDHSGRQLWREDPFDAARMRPYRYFKPVIVFVGPFPQSQFRQENEAACAAKAEPAVVLAYNSTQAGCLNVRTGRFVFLGQD